MNTPPVRSLALAPSERLDAVLATYRSRWSPHTIAAARALSPEETEHLMPFQWMRMLDELEVRMAPVVRTLDPQSESRVRCH